jgi:hypothetical protein
MAETKVRTFRCPADLWEAASRTAESRGETVTAVLVRALVEYRETHCDHCGQPVAVELSPAVTAAVSRKPRRSPVAALSEITADGGPEGKN